MASKAADPSSKPKIPLEELMERGHESLISKIRRLKSEIETGRRLQVKEKLNKNGEKLRSFVDKLNSSVESKLIDISQLWVESTSCVLDGYPSGSEDKDLANIHEDLSSHNIIIPKVQRLPSYTTWIFLNRNQRMVEGQTVVGRKRIYYDQSGNETLISSDSDDDLADTEEEKREFSDGEDRILWMAFQEHGLNQDIADVVCHFIGGTSSEVMERYNELKLKLEASSAQGSTERNILLEESLSGALDSFDNLFCRRCLIFDCRLHGCSQTLIYPREKPLGGVESEDSKPCCDQCYLLVGQTIDNPVDISSVGSLNEVESRICGAENKGPIFSSSKKICSYNGAEVICVDSDAEEDPTLGVISATSDLSIERHTIVGKRKMLDDNDKQLQITDSFKDSIDKKQKNIQAADATAIPVEELHVTSKRRALEQTTSLVGRKKGLLHSSEWKPLEKDLYTKGLEIFGKNSCLIARNLLSGLKTCTEVFNYMLINDRAGADGGTKEQDMPVKPRSRIFRKRGRTRKLKFSSKSTGHPSSRKRIVDENQAPRMQYTPCTCESMCGKDCSCLKIGVCCEKYCGCSKSCKNRFRGCHCAKSQCRSRQCPCFAANRECDPDVCRNCWVSCGGGSLGEPPKKGEGQCENMKLLLRQHKRVLLGRSDVAGWGAFIKDSVNKNECLGEYTGELISNGEADKRGKIYDLVNSSFLFDLNDQYVLDACRHGDKLKFANHSAKPNCFCKVMMVRGDHRVGIFAKERLEAQEEIFYDYCYGPDEAPEWARKPGSSKKDDSIASQSRPRKHQSR